MVQPSTDGPEILHNAFHWKIMEKQILPHSIALDSENPVIGSIALKYEYSD